MKCDGRVQYWLSEVITWHQLVEWYQFYLLNPFGDSRADLSRAIAGCRIVNEITMIAAGLAGEKDVKLLQVADLLPFGESSSNSKKETPEQEYYRKWKQSKDERLAAAKARAKKAATKTKRKSKRDPDPQ